MSNFRVKMDFIPPYLHKILKQKATIHIYSFPNFILEIFLALSICIIYCILHYEVTKLEKINQYIPHRLICKKSLKGHCILFLYCQLPPHFPCPGIVGRIRILVKKNFKFQVCSSKDSFCTSVTHIRHELRKLSSTTTHLTFKKYYNGESLLLSKRNWECKDTNKFLKPFFEDHLSVIDKFIAISPAQYVKLEKDRKIREKDLKNCLKSLTTLYSNVIENKISQGTIERQIQQAREDLLFPRPVAYLGFDTAALTKSLFDLLEKIVTESSIDKPLPFKGDITTLAMDAGNLHMDFYTSKNDDKINDDESLSSDVTTTNTACTTYTGISSHFECLMEDQKLMV